MANARRVRASSLSRLRTRFVQFDLLECRRLLSVAPVAADDAYQLGADNRASAGNPASTALPAFDESRWPVLATGPFTTPDYERTIEAGESVVETEQAQMGYAADALGTVTVRGAGARWTVQDWVEMGYRGKATLTVSDGGAVVVARFLDTADHGLADILVSNGGSIDARSWTAIGEAETGSTGGGSGSLTVTGPTSRWTSGNWFQVGYGRSRGTFRLLDGARMNAVGREGGYAWVGVGTNGGFGTLEISGGSVFQTDGWVSAGDGGGGAQGEGLALMEVRGAGSAWRLGNFMSLGTGGGRAVLNIADGGSVSVGGNWVDIGQSSGADARVLVGGGSTFTYTDRILLGQGILGASRGTLYVAEGGRVIGRTSPFARAPEITNYVGGRILGSGSIQGEVSNFGYISPGGSTGLLTINGDLLQPQVNTTAPAYGNTGVVHFDIGGAERGTQYDAFDVSGTAHLDAGKVVLNFVNGFAPRTGQRFVLVDAADLAQTTSNVEIRGLAPGFQYRLEPEDDRLVLTALNDGVAAATPPAPGNGVLANDTDADGDALYTVLVRRPEHGTVTLLRDGTFTYVPGPSFTGVDSFVYKADDGLFTSGPATVTIRNEAPVARDDAYAVDEDGTLTVAASDGVLKNDSDSVSPTLTAEWVRGPEHGTLALNADGSFVYEPDDGFSGTDTFTYRASDGSVRSTATVTITVRPINAAPVANADRATVRQGGELVLRTSELSANDTDADGDTLRVTGVAATADTHGTVSLSGDRVTYRPDRKYAGPASFTYTISDGQGGTATGTVNVTVLRKQRGAPGMAVGSGTLSSGRKIFQLSVHARGDGGDVSIRGNVSYRDLSRRLALRSGDIDVFELSGNGKVATIGGAASVNGRDGYRFEITAEDKSSSGRNDRFRILITGPDGFRYDSGSGSGGDRIDRGNIVIAKRGRDD